MKRLLALAFVMLLVLGNTSYQAEARDESQAYQPRATSAESSPGATNEKAVIDRLCPAPSREIDGSTFRFLRDRLGGVDLGEELLGTVEASLLQAAEVCDIQTSDRTRRLLAALLVKVAHSWWKHEELTKADSAFDAAFELDGTGSPPFLNTGVLKSWAQLKIDLGDSWAAKELTDRQTALVQEKHDRKLESPLRIKRLVQALRDQAYVYDVIGLNREAAEIKDRAEQLEAGLPRCVSGCVYVD